jgi:DNA repair protein RadC
LESFLRSASVANPRAAAAELSAHYSTISELLVADPAVIASYAGEGAAVVLSQANELMAWASEEQLRERTAICDQRTAARYLKATIGFCSDELLIVLFLDVRRRLIDREVIAVGRPDSVDFDLRRILLRAIGRGASGIIVAHNHPSGDARPSSSDVEVTRRLVDAAHLFRIALHDHFVVAGGHVRSAIFGN